jgi:hypothetical protein
LILDNLSVVLSSPAASQTQVGVFDSASLNNSAFVNVTGGSKLVVNAGLDLNTR